MPADRSIDWSFINCMASHQSTECFIRYINLSWDRLDLDILPSGTWISGVRSFEISGYSSYIIKKACIASSRFLTSGQIILLSRTILQNKQRVPHHTTPLATERTPLNDTDMLRRTPPIIHLINPFSKYRFSRCGLGARRGEIYSRVWSWRIYV